jgi:hypothetical protein
VDNDTNQCSSCSSTDTIITLLNQKAPINLQIPANITKEVFRKALEEFFIADAQPFTLSENLFFVRLLEVCMAAKQRYDIPKADALKESIMKRIDLMKNDLSRDLNRCEKPINLVIDGWTSPNYKSYIAVIGTYLTDDWERREELLGFQELQDHSGASMAEVVVQILKDLKVDLKRVDFVMADNASNVDSMCTALQDLLGNPNWKSAKQRLRCFAHILNLSCAKFLEYLGANSAGFEQQEKIQLIEEKDGEDNIYVYFDQDDLKTNWNEYKDTKYLIRRLRFAIKKLRSSPQQRDAFLKYAAAEQDSALLPILDVPTRWNSTYLMLQRILKLKATCTTWISKSPTIGKVTLESETFSLSEDDWDLIKRFTNHLQWFFLLQSILVLELRIFHRFHSYFLPSLRFSSI